MGTVVLYLFTTEYHVSYYCKFVILVCTDMNNLLSTRRYWFETSRTVFRVRSLIG